MRTYTRPPVFFFFLFLLGNHTSSPPAQLHRHHNTKQKCMQKRKKIPKTRHSSNRCGDQKLNLYSKYGGSVARQCILVMMRVSPSHYQNHSYRRILKEFQPVTLILSPQSQFIFFKPQVFAFFLFPLFLGIVFFVHYTLLLHEHRYKEAKIYKKKKQKDKKHTGFLLLDGWM